MGSLYCSDITKYVERTTNLVAASSDYSVVGETYIDALPPSSGSDYSNIWAMANGFGTYTEWVAIFIDHLGNVSLSLENGSGALQSAPANVSELSVFTWAYTRSGNTHKFYVNGILIDTLTYDISGASLTAMRLGSDGASGTNNEQNLEYSYFREWNNEVRTLDEIITEWNSPTAVIAAYTDTPLVDDLLDDSGNSHTWTAHGSPAFAPGWIPVPYTNTSSGTAFTATVDLLYLQVPITAGVSGTSWFKTTSPAILVQLGVQAFSDDYSPRITPYDSSVVPITGSSEGHANYPFMFPVIPGDDYYIRIRNGASTAGSLNFKINSSNNTDVPVGSLLIPSDVNGWNAALVDTTSSVLQYKAFPAGEATAVLDDGTILTVDAATPGRMCLYDNQLNKLLDIDSVYGRWITVSGDRTFFYVADNDGGGKVTTINADGSFGPTTWALATAISGFQGMAVSPDDTILYWVSFDRKTIKRHDLVNDVPLSDFAAALTGYSLGTREILCLADGKVIGGYYKPLTDVEDQYFFRIYNSDGTVFTSYTYTTNGIYSIGPFRLAYSSTDPTHFWAWINLYDAADAGDENGIAAFFKIRVSDGVVVTDIRVRLFVTSGAFGVFTSTPDTQTLGPSESCSFIELRAEVPAVGEDTGTIVVVKITDPPDDTTEFDFTSDTLGDFSLSGGGSQIFDNLTPGTFDVAEVVNPDFQNTIGVSNGSPASAITVAAGETVTVTVRNYKLEPLSGLYILVPDKRYDTLYSSIQQPGPGIDPTFTTEDVKIPDPYYDVFLAGDE